MFTSTRFKCRFGIIWTCLLILQLFQFVLLQNVTIMKDDLRHTKSARGKRNIDRGISEVLSSIEKTTDKMRKKDNSFDTSIKKWFPNCSYVEDVETLNFWKEQNSIYPMYLSLSTIGLYSLGCSAELESRLRELLNLADKNDVIDLYEQIGEDDFQLNFTNNITQNVDIDDEVNIQMVEGSDFVADNINSISQLSDIMQSMNSSTARSVYGLESILDDTISEYDALSIVLDSELNRKKRSLNTPQQSKFSKRMKLKMFHSNTNILQQHFKNKRQQLLGTFVNDNINIRRPKKVSYLKNRYKRSIMDTYDLTATPFFVRNSDIPCKVLMVKRYFDQFYLTFDNYDKENMYKQMWLWINGTIQNYETDFFLDVDSNFSLSESVPAYKLFTNGSHLSPDSLVKDCFIEVNVDFDRATLVKSYIRAKQIWYFIPYESLEENFNGVVCFFFIQSNDSCLVITENTDTKDLFVQTVNKESIERQIWYWDSHYIRNAHNHEYLSSSTVGSFIQALQHDGDINQKWSYQKGYLHAEDIYGNVVLSTGSSLTVEHQVNSSYQQWSLINTELDDVTKCIMNKNYYVIKNSNIPCKVLCTISESTLPSLLIQTGIAAGFVTIGLIGAIILYYKFEKSCIAFSIGVAAGLVMAVISLSIINFTSFFNKNVTELRFDYFDDKYPQKCTWYDNDGSILNLESDQAFYRSDNDNSEIKLSDDKSEKWHFQNENIVSLSSQTCYITFDTNTTLRSVCSGKVKNQWSIVRYDNSMNFFYKVLCLFFLKQTSNDINFNSLSIKNYKSCGMLTEMEEKNEIEIRIPSTELFLNQLWYYSGSDLVNLKSGNVLQKHFKGWVPIELNTSLGTPDVISCRSNLFFIRSKTVPCKVLEQNPENGALEFQMYDEIKLSSQLWLYNSDAIINYDTGLYLSSKDMISGSTMFLSNKSNSLHQNWTIEKQTIFKIHQNNTVCFLNVHNESYIVSLDCSINGTQTNVWEFTPYDTDFNFLGYVLCTYFIQSEKEPCELLTGNKNSSDVFMRPASEELLLLQLWYTLNNQIVHLDSGSYLGVFIENGTRPKVELFQTFSSNTTWSLGNIISFGNKRNEMLTINEQDGSLTVTQPLHKANVQFWRFLESKFAFDNIEILTCIDNDSRNFFIKVNSVDCKVLTATSKGQSPIFEQFDETKINLQLWQWKFAYIVNVETGLSFHLDDTTGDIILLETESYYLQNRQFYLSGRNIVSRLTDQNLCGLITYKTFENKQILFCDFNMINYIDFQWELIEYNIALSDVSRIMCVYFIRTKDKPCEYLTGFGQGNSLKVRPMVHELVQNQLFYWQGSHIIHMESGLRLTANHTALVLEDVGERLLQSWNFVEYRLQTLKSEGLVYVYFKPHIDGRAFVGHETTSMPHKWIFQEMSKTLNGLDIDESCEGIYEINSTFFIKNTEHPCLVLTSGSLGNSPEFMLYDETKIHSQLWYFQENHIVNFGNGLSLMMDIDAVNAAFSVNMWHYYSYSTLQMWNFKTNSTIESIFLDGCLIVPDNEEQQLTIKSSCNIENHSNWQFILMDQNYEFFNEITCMFFIQTLVTPCELLTAIGQDVKLRPVDQKNINAQLWLWDGKHILNAESGLALTASDTKIGSRLGLMNKSFESTEQMWNHQNTFLTLSDYPNITVGFSVTGGYVTMYPKRAVTFQKWKFIDREKGIEKPNTLQCISKPTNTDVYYIRSEYGDCPLLSYTWGSNVGVRMLESGPLESKGWMKDKNHIINIKTLKSLSINPVGILFLENTYAHEIRQFWERHQNALFSYPYTKFRVMTYGTLYLSSLPYRGGSNQIWKWYTVNEIERNDKLLRCSRCYNEGEETANNVMSYIPFFGWLYSFFRAIVYAVKDCPKVAWDSLKSMVIDFAMNAAIALLTIATAGTLSALAVGIKTGIKAGFKAGVKAAFKGMKSMIKTSVKSFNKLLKNTVERGFTKTLRAKITTMKRSLTNSVKTIKSIPQRLKAITNNVVKRIKMTSKHQFKLVRTLIKRSDDLWINKVNIISRIGETIQVTLKNMPEKIKRTLKNTGEKTKNRMSNLLNKLAEPAEKAMMQLDELKFTMNLRCRRTTGKFCKLGNGQTNNKMIEKAYQFEGSTDLPAPKEVKDQYNQLLKNVDISGQTAVIGVKQSDNIIYKQSSKIDDLRQSGKKPIPKDKIDVSGGKSDVRHTEQDLFINVKDTLKDCTPQKRCDVFLYTKLSPCRQHPKTYAKSCMDYIIETCKEWFEIQKIRCHVGFDKFYDDGIQIFKSSDWGDYFENAMGSRRKSKNDIENLLRKKGYSEESLLYAEKLIKENRGVIETNLEKKLANAYEQLFKNIQKDFKLEYNTVLKSLKEKNNPVSSVLKEFEDLLTDKIDSKTAKRIVQNFENTINRHNEVYIRNLLNEISTKRAVMKDMQSKAGGTSTNFIDFFHLVQ